MKILSLISLIVGVFAMGCDVEVVSYAEVPRVRVVTVVDEPRVVTVVSPPRSEVLTVIRTARYSFEAHELARRGMDEQCYLSGYRCEVIKETENWYLDRVGPFGDLENHYRVTINFRRFY